MNKKILADRISKLMDKTLTNIEQSIKQHTVPEGRGLITRQYVLNTIEFELNRLGKEIG